MFLENTKSKVKAQKTTNLFFFNYVLPFITKYPASPQLSTSNYPQNSVVQSFSVLQFVFAISPLHHIAKLAELHYNTTQTRSVVICFTSLCPPLHVLYMCVCVCVSVGALYVGIIFSFSCLIIFTHFPLFSRCFFLHRQ